MALNLPTTTRRFAKLVLPVLLPSWRFFAAIAPSPRIEIECLDENGSATGAWREFRPPPTRLSAAQVICRLIYNRARNEDLYFVSLSERLIASPDEMIVGEIEQRIADHLAISEEKPPHLVRFRLLFVCRMDDRLERHICFLSHPFTLDSASDR